MTQSKSVATVRDAVFACLAILQRYDLKTEITALKLAIEELKAKKQESFEHA